jgi:hypothetical protein
LGLILALVLSARALHAQDSGDSSAASDSSDTSDTGVASDDDAFSSAPPSAIDANTAIDAADATTVDFASQQAINAVTTPWGGVPTPVALATDIQMVQGVILFLVNLGSRALLRPARQRRRRNRFLRIQASPLRVAHKFTRSSFPIFQIRHRFFRETSISPVESSL